MKFSKEGFLRHLALFSAILASGGNKIIPGEVWLVLCAICCLALLQWRIPLHRRLSSIYLWIVLVDVLLVFQGGMSALPSVASRTLVFLTSVLLIQVYLKRSMEQLMSDLFGLGRFMAVQAIITFILGTVAPGLFLAVNINEITYKTIAFVFTYHNIENVGIEYIRPNGFFYEPGVFQIYLSIFLYLCLLWRLTIRWAVIACVAQLTLWSTTGLLITIGLLLLSTKRIYSSSSSVWRPVIAIVFMVSLVPMTYAVVNNVEEKTSGGLRGSSYARLYDLNTGVSIIQRKPLEGIGFSTEQYLEYSNLLGAVDENLSAALLLERPNTNGLVQTLYAIGIPLGGYLLIGLFRQKVFSSRIAMAVILILSLYAEPLTFTPFFLLILLSWMLKEHRQPIRMNHAS